MMENEILKIEQLGNITTINKDIDDNLDYICPNPIRSYNVKLRITSKKKGLPVNYMARNLEQWEELTLIMNKYMIERNWNITDALNFMRDTLVKSAKVTGVKKHMFDKQCDSMKDDFEKWSDLKNTNDHTK